ncbi:heavy metal translocating P-type ATPase [Thiothrix litoralis]|uniref:P-type Zn(2+) transporter n=1 Tax=Thiothrix litoralis TaxID=2891210 RepID=A0ABX7WWY5_9GAMM|nr:heavy metal translocating P-type ATPase [Thiothrix litoralis]QTR45450.1 heavy metal translocating P-type ATPase [Thiothrix litoralis]
MIGVLAISFIASHIATRVVKAKKHKSKLKQTLLPHKPVITPLEDRFQAAIEQKFDRILGDKRNQQLQRLSGSLATAEIPAEAKQDNRYLLSTGLNAWAAVLLGVIAPAWLILTVPFSLYLVRKPFQRAWHGVMHEGRVSVNVVDSAAVSIALLTGFWQVTAISLFLYATALKLLNRAKQKSRQQLSNMFTQTPATVWIQRGEVEAEIKLKNLQADDIVVVRSGEVIPVDGLILQGTGLVDQRALTGESQPAEKQVGDEVFACTLLLSGRVQIQVQSTGQQTVVARIGELLQKTAGYKNQHEFQAERFTDRSVVPTLLLSALALPVSGVSGTIGVLWSCFGYNMRITSPMSVMNFLRHASEQQILIKDGMALDTLPNIDTVVFDKTGTLTEEEPELYRIHIFAQYGETTMLAYAAAAEYRQTHPIARAILAAANKQELSLPGVEDSYCKLGYGIEARIDGQTIQIGSARFMESSGIKIPETAWLMQTEAETSGHSIVMLAIGNVLAGAIELRPQIRTSAQQVIQALKAQGIRTCIISGDRDLPTRRLSETLGIDQYFANTLPEQKAEIVQRLQAEGSTVCFVGDGINDAIALKQADISVSLSGATTAATDTAQIILMDADLIHLVTLTDMGRQFQQNQQQNMRISVIPAIISIGGIFILHGGLLLAAGMFYGGMGLGVRNAIRPIRPPRLENNQESSHANPTATQAALSVR